MSNRGSLKGVHTLIHLAFLTDRQIERIRGFGGHVVTTTQPGFWPVESDTEYYYGERASQAYQVKKMFDSGISVGISTDFSVSPLAYSPASVVIGVAATGAGSPRIHQPTSIKDMIEGFTMGSARTTGRSDVGKLEKGYKADLVVYDKDFFVMDPSSLSASNPKVLATFVGGRRIKSDGMKN